MRADIDMDVAAFADEAHRAPHLGAADRVQPGLRIARGVERQIGVTSVGEILDGGHRIVRAGIDRRIGAERFGALEPLRADVERDHFRAHRLGILRGRQPDWPLAEDRDGVVAGKVHPAQRAVGGAGTAGNRSPRRER